MYTEGIKVVIQMALIIIISRHGTTPICGGYILAIATIVNDIIILGDRHMTDTGNETIVMMRSTILSMAYILLQLHACEPSKLTVDLTKI